MNPKYVGVKTVYEQWREAREVVNGLYLKVTATNGRLQIGPSGTIGVYIKTEDQGKEVQISRITEDEARWICQHFAHLFGFAQNS